MQRQKSAAAAAALLLSSVVPGLTQAKDVTLAWDPVDDPRVHHYEGFWGTASRVYPHSQATSETSLRVTDLEPGTYYFAVRACAENNVLCSDFSNEVSTTIPKPLVARFIADKNSGETPLTVTLTDMSEGIVDRRDWDVGDGNSYPDGGAVVVHTYVDPGTYDVRLMVTGPGGSDEFVLTNAVVAEEPVPEPDPTPASIYQHGTAQVDHAGLWVDMDLSVYTSPVVVATITSENDRDPVTVRVTDIASDGFRLMLKEWPYQDGVHAPEAVAYLVVDEGVHTLPGGGALEAGIVNGPVGAFIDVPLQGPFSGPVVLGTVMDTADKSAVAVRFDGTGPDGFGLRLDEQESSPNNSGSRQVGFIAIETGSGKLGDYDYWAGVTPNNVTNVPSTVPFGIVSPFERSTMRLLGGIQTYTGDDPSVLGISAVDGSGATIYIREEQSFDTETRHYSEGAGLFAIGKMASGTGSVAYEVGEVPVNSEGTTVQLNRAFNDPVVIATVAGGNEEDPHIVCVDNVTPESFFVRLKEWSYLDGVHGNEAVQYFVVERGLHELPGGAWIEADGLSVTDQFTSAAFQGPYPASLVVNTTVSSCEGDPVEARVNNVTPTGFDGRVDREEADMGIPVPSTPVNYVAVSPGIHTLDDSMVLEAGQTGDAVTNVPFRLEFNSSCTGREFLLPDMYTLNGDDPSNVRYTGLTASGADIWIDEEQSEDPETRHYTEGVGYMAICPQ